MIITARSASAVQLELMTAGVFMVDMGKPAWPSATLHPQPRWRAEHFVTLAQVKTWAKYTCPPEAGASPFSSRVLCHVQAPHHLEPLNLRICLPGSRPSRHSSTIRSSPKPIRSS